MPTFAIGEKLDAAVKSDEDQFSEDFDTGR